MFHKSGKKYSLLLLSVSLAAYYIVSFFIAPFLYAEEIFAFNLNNLSPLQAVSEQREHNGLQQIDGKITLDLHGFERFQKAL
jgi:hypothetical protein